MSLKMAWRLKELCR